MENKLPRIILQSKMEEPQQVEISYEKTCECTPNKLNCMTAKEWIKSQLGVWQFTYEKRDMRDRTQHPATFPISLSKL